MRVLLIGSALLVLGGCAQNAATLSAEGTYLLNAALDHVHRVHDKRRTVEELCWLSGMLTVQGIRNDDTKTEADVRTFLLTVYPRLVTLDLVRKAKEDPNGILATPPGCPVEDKPGETIMGPPLKGVLVPEDPIS